MTRAQVSAAESGSCVSHDAPLARGDSASLTSQTRFVLGFVFSPDFSHVLLIRKNRPHWMAGKLNGIGGHAEADERLGEAMIRECREETGLEIADWTQCGAIVGADVHVSVYWAVADLLFTRRATDEKPEIYPVEMILLPVSGLSTVEHVVSIIGTISIHRAVGLDVPFGRWAAPEIAAAVPA